MFRSCEYTIVEPPTSAEVLERAFDAMSSSVVRLTIRETQEITDQFDKSVTFRMKETPHPDEQGVHFGGSILSINGNKQSDENRVYIKVQTSLDDTQPSTATVVTPPTP